MFMADIFYANPNCNIWKAKQCYATQMSYMDIYGNINISVFWLLFSWYLLEYALMYSTATRCYSYIVIMFSKGY